MAKENKDDLVSVEQILYSDWPYRFAVASNGSDEGWDRSCPCCLIHGDGFEVRVHCWRAGGSCCEFSGIHISGTISDEGKQRVAEHIRDNNGWTDATDWSIVVE